MSSLKEGDKDAWKFKMQKRPELNNGGSLEDCISNVYTLLELPGIKWKCFRTKSNAPRGVPLTSDLVLKAYSKCVLDGILCTWRRKPLPPTDNHELLPIPHFSNDTPKELWVFWYDDEPAVLPKHCEGLESDEELSSANQMNIVSYEVRTILFKALHVVLERDLTKDGFVRFGRWFTVPYAARENYLHYMYPTHSPAIRFNFFLHGSSTICASIQAQRQPTLISLSKRHLECKSTKRFPLVVGPWSMRGFLVQDQMTLLTDPKMQETAEKEWNQWKEYLQLEEKEPVVVEKEPVAEETQLTRNLIENESSDEDKQKSQDGSDEIASDDIPQNCRWMYEPEYRQEKPKEETPEEKEERERAREVRRKRRKNREERVKQLEKQRADVENPEEYDSDVVTDEELEEKDESVSNEVPKMVLIEIDEIRMLYPSKFLCITLEEDRQMLESMGLKTNPVPQELQAQGRRPRIKQVVNAMYPILSTMAVYQYCKNEQRKKRASVAGNKTNDGQLLPPKNSWKFKNRMLGCGKCWVCSDASIDYRPVQFVNPKKEVVKTIYPKDRRCDVMERMITHVRKKKNFHAYHKQRPSNPANDRRIKKRKRIGRTIKPRWQRTIAQMRAIRKRSIDLRIKHRKQYEEDRLPPSGTCRVDSEDEAYQMDKNAQNDWANFNDEHPKGIPAIEVPADFEQLNEVGIKETKNGEDYKPEQFLPITFFTNTIDNNDFDALSGDDEMNEERFNQVFKDKFNKWKPDMSRGEKIENGNYMFDPLNRMTGSPRSYHLKEQRKSKYESILPTPIGNKFFTGDMCRKGLRGFEQLCAERDEIDRIRKAKWLKKQRRKVSKHEIKVARTCHLEMQKQIVKRSLKRTIKKLQITAKKDSVSDGTKQDKLLEASLKTKKDDNKFEKSLKEVEDVLDKLDVNSFCEKLEEAGPYGVPMSFGYIDPDYDFSPHSFVEEEPELEIDEQRTGLGEGTSVQYQDGESVDMSEPEREQINDSSLEISSIGHIRTVGEHIGPDGLLSPPASNEMPKGGPLSVGPPSIESQGLNQIYPTPPSVQMLQGDAAQPHSPVMHGKTRFMMNLAEEDIERVAVPGGGGSIVEIDADDFETKNMQKWNKLSNQSKLSKFLASSCNNPILKGRKKKYDTPVTEKFKIESEAEKISAKLVYKPMVSRKFDCPPHRSFAALVRPTVPDKRLPSSFAIPSTSSLVHPGMTTPMAPLFQSPTIPPHSTPSPFSAGPMGHHPMGPPAYPVTPGPFPPTTPTYPGMTPRPGSNFGPGPGYPNPHQMGGPGYPGHMGHMGPMGPQRQFSNPQMYQQQMQYQMRMQMQMRQMSGQGVPPGYGSAGVPPYQQGPTTPGTPGFGMSMQRLNNFVNQSQFTPNSGHSMPYGSMQPMIPQSPNFNQPYNQMGNPMMSPMQQHQFHQQQQLMQQQQQFQMQRNQMQLQNPQPQQQPFQPTAQMLKTQQSEQVYMAFQQLSEREKRKFQRRQVQLLNGLMPTSLQPAAIRNLKNPPDANIPYKKQDTLYRPPEPNVVHGDSLTIAIVFSDTLLDLHFDSVFDACPICSCSVSIRSRDLGMYIAPHIVLRSKEPEHTNMREHTQGTWSGFHVNAPTNCTCGFSAIRHRYLSCCSGLFEEDSDEATTSSFSVAPVIPPLDYPKKSTARDMKWFDSKSVHDMALLDQIRQMSFSNSLGKAISHMATVREHNRNIASAVELGTDITVPSEYILSHVDTHELLMLGNSVLGPMKKSGSGNPIASFQQLFAFFHPWGFQVANEIAELESSEWIDLLGIVTPTLEVSMKQARNLSAENSFTIEGPLTWKQIVTKAVRGKPASDDDEDFSLAEPVPAVMRALTKEAIRAAPNIEQYYDQASLGPVDQPKDVMYITVIPDDNEVYAKTVKFMDKVTSTYERMRLGRHIPFPVSTGTATRFREVYKSCQSQFPFPEQQQQLVSYTNQSLRNVPQKLADTPDPLNTDPETWSKRTKRKFEMQQENRENFDLEDCEKLYEESKKNYRTFPRLQDKEYENCPNGFYEREGILRVGTPQEPTRIQHNVTNTAEFEKMTKHLSDENGFVTRLRLYLQQMEDLVYSALNENPEAFERRGYRYQMAVEGRLKRQKHKRDIEEERLRFEAAKLEDEQSSLQKPDENDLSGIELGNNPIEPWVNDELEEKKRKRQKEDEQYLPEGHQAHQQAPSPVPAGMIHIPETLSEQERAVQPGLNEIFADPTTVAPLNAQNISWTQRDTRVPNPFPSSNQPPIAFEAAGSRDTDAYSTLPHVIVIYMINPFSYGTEGRSALHMRIAVLAFIRAFNSIMCRLPYQKRPQLQLEIVGLESIDDVAKAVPDYFNDPKVPFDILHELPVRFEKSSEVAQTEIARSLSVAVYTHPRVFFPDVYKSVSARCMTAFGPGSQLIDVIQQIEQINNDAFFRMAKRSKTAMNIDGFNNSGIMPPQQCEKKNYIAYRVPSNIVCLAPPPPVYQLEENGKPIMNQLDEQTLFISYCLVGTEFLVATATDAQGKLIDNCIANIKPRRESNEVYRYKNKTQILDGMGKLWSFILGVMSSEIKNWRLVVGRLGRIGHGEFRAWTHLLNKTSLLRYSGSLKDICTACRSMPSVVGTPAILSACLITLEPEPSIRIMPDFHDQEASPKKSLIFQTPGDLSCTHILTFPVGTEINLEVQDQTADTKADENWEFGDLDIMEGLDDGDTEIMKDLGLETPSSAAIRQSGGTSMFFSEDSSAIEIQNQPLASGYYISTAPAPELPSWFWATCPSAKRHSPVHLKSSLHININEVKNDDIAMESTKEKDKEKEKEEKDVHPLESRQTEEVLRHVLESYNALSWLNLNRQTGDRYSCLPIHIQHLLRLYHSVARLLA